MDKGGGENNPIDLNALRKQLSQKAREANPASREPVTLNPLALQVANQLRGNSHSPNIVIGQLRLFEFVILTLIGIVINMLETPQEFSSQIVLIAICIWNGAISSMLLLVTDCYQLPLLRRPVQTIPRVLGSLLAAFALTIVTMMMLLPQTVYSWQTLGVWFAVSAVFILIERIIVGLAIRHWGRNGVMERRAVIVEWRTSGEGCDPLS